jgi:hypothetical protein
LEDQGEQRKESDYDSHIGLSLKRNCCTVFADKPLLVCPIAQNLGPMQLYMLRLGSKAGTEQYLPAELRPPRLPA